MRYRWYALLLLGSAMLLLVAPPDVPAADILPHQPDQVLMPEHTIMMNHFRSVLTYGPYMLATMDDGIVVCHFDDARGVFIPGPFEFLAAPPVDMRFTADSAHVIVHMEDHALSLFDARQLPDLVRVTTFAFDEPFADYAISGNTLFLARWFDGVHRYQLDYQQGTTQYSGGSRYPVSAAQVQVWSDTLYVLDEYNGLMRWALSRAFTSAPDQLLVPRRARSFARNGELFYLPLVAGENELFVGTFGHQGSGIVDTVVGEMPPERVFHVGNRIVLVSPVSLRILHLDSAAVGQELVSKWIRGVGTDGDVFSSTLGDYLVLPDKDAGLALFDLVDGAVHAGLNRSQAINGLQMYQGRIMVSTLAGPIDVYRVDSLEGEASYTLGEDYEHLHAMDRNGDTLIIVHSWPTVLSLIRQVTGAESAFVEGSTGVGVPFVRAVRYVPGSPTRTPGVVLFARDWFDVYRLQAQGQVTLVTQAELEEGITACEVSGDLVLVATDRNRVYLYRLSDNLHPELVAVGDAPATVTALAMLPSQAYAFAGNRLLMIDLESPSPRLIDSVKTPVPEAFAAAIDNNRLFTVGSAGIAVYRLGYSAPELIEQGGLSGHLLAIEDGNLITSRGAAVYVYRLLQYADDAPDPESLPVLFTLSQNYPNPFNAGTTIEFSVTDRTRIELTIYNLLGQEVTRLIDGPVDRGTHAVVWNGANSAGDLVASGVYFYQLQLADRVATRKMILLK